MNPIDIVIIIVCTAILLSLVVTHIIKSRHQGHKSITCSGEYGCPAQVQFKRVLKQAKKSMRTKS